MNAVATKVSEREAIAQTLEQYIAGARSGRGDQMRPAFHEEATIFGYAGEDLFAGPIELLFDWSNANGPSPSLEVEIAGIDIVGTVATARLELKNLGGHRFTDLFTLLKTDGRWKIMNKVFHLHE